MNWSRIPKRGNTAAVLPDFLIEFPMDIDEVHQMTRNSLVAACYWSIGYIGDTLATVPAGLLQSIQANSSKCLHIRTMDGKTMYPVSMEQSLTVQS